MFSPTPRHQLHELNTHSPLALSALAQANPHLSGGKPPCQPHPSPRPVVHRTPKTLAPGAMPRGASHNHSVQPRKAFESKHQSIFRTHPPLDISRPWSPPPPPPAPSTPVILSSFPSCPAPSTLPPTSTPPSHRCLSPLHSPRLQIPSPSPI